MTLLVLGLLVWSGAHLVKPGAPDVRAAAAERLGAGPAKGLFAALIALGLVLMILGYRAAPFVAVWTPPGWTVHLNNLMMLGAVFVFGMGMSKGRARAWLRHPMLTAVVIWAAAHLLVNGDLASILLFGGLALWALASMAAINRRDGAWVRPAPGPAAGDLRLVAITLVTFALIAAVHAWLGVWPFPG
jgi:uncharacterized membrane protein